MEEKMKKRMLSGMLVAAVAVAGQFVQPQAGMPAVGMQQAEAFSLGGALGAVEGPDEQLTGESGVHPVGVQIGLAVKSPHSIFYFQNHGRTTLHDFQNVHRIFLPSYRLWTGESAATGGFLASRTKLF